MLNIPDSIKALFKQDGVYKNFRAHFPGGQLPDITNDDIVQESVKFTESICSQDVFKFGLTEASTIEFETVGVGNMYGMDIECSVEIDGTSLSAAQIADIEAGTWDGEITYTEGPGSSETFSGDLVSFAYGGDAQISVLDINITATQSGTGDASPTNIRPINGFTEAKLWIQPTHDTSANPTVTVNLNDTVYGGTLDFLTGELTVTWVGEYVKNLNWSYSSSKFVTPSSSQIYKTKKNGTKNVLCSYYWTSQKSYHGNQENLTIIGNSGTSQVYIKDTNYTSAATWKAAMGDALIIWELATPQTVQLTAASVTPLNGMNFVWTNTGSIKQLTVGGTLLVFSGFRVPYGTFRVESCPRDHQSMAHRKVTAYTEDMSEPNEFEQKKLAVYGWSKTYDPFIMSLVLGQVASKSPQTILGCGYTETDVSSLTTGTLVLWDQQFTAKDAGGTDHPLTFRVNGKHMGSTSGSWMLNKFDLYRFDYADSYNDYQTIIDSAVSILESMGIDATQSGFTSLEELAKANLPATFKPHELAFNTRLVPKSGEIFYPYLNPVAGKNVETYGIPLRLDMFISGTITDSTVIPYNPQSISGFSADTPTLTRYSPSDTTEMVKVAFESTLSTRGSLGLLTVGKTINLYSFSNAYSAKDVAQGYLELNAEFATAARDGGNRIIRISNASPVSVIPGEYRQMWVDEYDVEPIGTIRYSYTDEAGEEQIVDYQFGDGASVYDMTDNAVLKMMDGADPSVIEPILDSSFIPYIGAVNFMPIDLTMKGLPYIEAGDALQVTAQDAAVYPSYALRHEISGIQALEAQIDSQSGLIIESGDDT